MDKVIYIDLDGVCVDFIGSAVKLFGENKEDVMARWEPGLWDMSKVVGGDDFYKVLENGGEAFWENTELYEWADELYNFCSSIAPSYFLTMPTHDPQCLSGKLKMLQRWKGYNFDNYVMTRHKHRCATPGAMLIDDHDDNITKFKKAGGHGILFPSHTNSNHPHKDMAMKWTKEKLKEWDYDSLSKRIY